MFYQHIVTVSKYDTNVNQEISTLFGEPQIRVGLVILQVYKQQFENLNSDYLR